VTHFALDTSVAVPLLLRRHCDHELVRSTVADATVSMTGHSLAETYSVLTRLPGDARLDACDAARLLSSGFSPPLLLDPDTLADLPSILAAREVAGGAVYDAMVGLATVGTGATLLTRDRRAAATYAALGVGFAFV
jgi:predicted nucleic acid-binding protein